MSPDQMDAMFKIIREAGLPALPADYAVRLARLRGQVCEDAINMTAQGVPDLGGELGVEGGAIARLAEIAYHGARLDAAARGEGQHAHQADRAQDMLDRQEADFSFAEFHGFDDALGGAGSSTSFTPADIVGVSA